MIAHILTGQSLTVLLDGRTMAIPRSHANFDAILESVLYDDTDELRQLIDVKATVASWSNGVIEVIDRELLYKGNPLNTNLTSKIIEFVRDGDERLAVPLCNFLDKVMQNPSFRAVSGLYDWVAASEMPIHEDGDILAWKIVKDDFHDYYTGKFDHSPGKIVEQPRNQCNEDPDVTCSDGIHFCSFKYLPSYHQGDNGRRIMLVKINPADVVAIPREYNTAKGRCCKLTVVEQVPNPEEFFPTRTVYFEETPASVTPKGDNVFKVGQQWRDNDGDVHTILEVNEDEGFVRTEWAGSVYGFELDGTSLQYTSMSLDTLVEEAPQPEPVVEAPKFEVGQRWICRDGQVRTVTEPGHTAAYGPTLKLDDGGYVWADIGKVTRDYESPIDLITLVPQIDWTKPIETVTGTSRRFISFEQCEGRDVANVDYNYYDLITGEHLFNRHPTLRNVA